jgi:uncharacterized membrane protein
MATGNYPFRWTPQTGMTQLSELKCYMKGVSADGSVVFADLKEPSGQVSAYTWEASSGMERLALSDAAEGVLGGQAHAMTPDGAVIVGITYGQPNVEVAFLWRRGFRIDPLFAALSGEVFDFTQSVL